MRRRRHAKPTTLWWRHHLKDETNSDFPGRKRKKNLSKTPRTEAKNKPQTPTQLAGETETATTTATLNNRRRETSDTLPQTQTEEKSGSP
ncbi:hypothetical protein HID58_014398 [Brassica napus]|uniref:Uncharacterized protein n=1 Tax=Brassica napus TaxID=3708 RepID=A0ABQ8DJL8_BRANA|nr:hypothetical protein HID58_014398 [Brassica napus]